MVNEETCPQCGFCIQPPIDEARQDERKKATINNKFSLYLAYIVLVLSDWKYEVYASKKLESEIKMKAPCSYDANGLFIKAVKKFAPEMYDGKISFIELKKRVEKYLKQEA